MSETVTTRLEEIKMKLEHIPSDEDLSRYYIYYKEDVNFLLGLLDWWRKA